MLKEFFLKTSLFVVLGLTTLVAQAENFVASMENSQWEASEASPLQCSLSHFIPNFGYAEFLHIGGKRTSFHIKPYYQAMPSGKIHIISMAPEWKAGAKTEAFGNVYFNPDDEWLKLDEKLSALMLESLRKGMMPTLFQLDGDNQISARIASISPVNFISAYKKFQICEASLLPIGFHQIEKTQIYFNSGSAELSNDAKILLDLVVRYQKADKRFAKIYLDAHTDAEGTRMDNRELSKERSDSVINYLLARGMPENMIKAMYHGDRYPVASNATRAGKAKNRRVNIKIELNPPVDKIQ